MAYRSIIPAVPFKSVSEIVTQSVETWRGELVNDFEKPVFEMFPEIFNVREKLYELGAVYSAMSGSGSAVYGLFRELPEGLAEYFSDDYFFWSESSL
jgi:4-diphosphocytidyl-2-C-methyl-D-erythritol kinase